jgi:DNA-binding PadR family transcriptional regulator
MRCYIVQMSLKYAVLAALLEGDASGYDLAKLFDASMANFWTARPQQLYRELDKLEQEGLVVARLVQQQRRPNKRIFTLTDAGRGDLRAFTREPARPTVTRDALLVKVQAVDDGDIDAVRANIQERMDWARAKLTRYDQLREGFLNGQNEQDYLLGADRVGPYLNLMRGRLFEQENLRWGQQVLDILAGRMSHAGPR